MHSHFVLHWCTLSIPLTNFCGHLLDINKIILSYHHLKIYLGPTIDFFLLINSFVYLSNHEGVNLVGHISIIEIAMCTSITLKSMIILYVY